MHGRPEDVAGIEDDSGGSALCTLEAAERYITRSTDASSTCDGSGSAFKATFGALVDWGEARQIIRLPEVYGFLSRHPDGHGDEHEAWFDEPSGRWFKATYDNRFGLAWGRDETATPHEYLRRLLLQNEYFGDDIQLVALVNCAGKLRLLTSQPHIAGEAASYEAIQFWFQRLNFLRIEHDSRIAWYHEADNLLISDAHEGNVIHTAAGTLVPIDLNMLHPVGALLEWVRTVI